jgi:hypothetical protein
MDIAVIADVPPHSQEWGAAIRPGFTVRQTLLGDEAADGLNFRFVRNHEGLANEAFRTPRHHHPFQQIRWAETDSVNFAPGQDIPEGDIAYFPRGTYYGPQRKDRGAALLLQFGFGDEYQGGGKDWYERLGESIKGLESRGTLQDGVFAEIDPLTGQTRQRDAVAAVLEDRANKVIPIPAEGYAAPILMHPRAFSYHPASPGVEIKYLGRFYDHPGPRADVRLSMLRLSQSGTHHLRSDRAQVVWSVNDGLRIDGRAYPGLTCLYSARGEDAVLSGIDSVEVFVIELPRLD